MKRVSDIKISVQISGSFYGQIGASLLAAKTIINNDLIVYS